MNRWKSLFVLCFLQLFIGFVFWKKDLPQYIFNTSKLTKLPSLKPLQRVTFVILLITPMSEICLASTMALFWNFLLVIHSFLMIFCNFSLYKRTLDSTYYLIMKLTNFEYFDSLLFSNKIFLIWKILMKSLKGENCQLISWN